MISGGFKIEVGETYNFIVSEKNYSFNFYDEFIGQRSWHAGFWIYGFDKIVINKIYYLCLFFIKEDLPWLIYLA